MKIIEVVYEFHHEFSLTFSSSEDTGVKTWRVLWAYKRTVSFTFFSKGKIKGKGKLKMYQNFSTQLIFL
jgi:hypothetical protein